MKVTGEQYLNAQTDVANAGADPLQHVLTYVLKSYSQKEPRCLEYPDDFDGEKYIAAYQDLIDAGITDGLKHYLQYGFREGRWPLPAPIATDADEIIDFIQVPEMAIPTSCYFACDIVDGKLRAGTYGYQGGSLTSEIYEYPDVIIPLQRVSAESVISMCDGLVTLEQGGSNERAQILNWDGSKYALVVEHPRWNLMLGLHKHSDGYYYATGQKFGDPSDPAGWMRSLDKKTWSVWHENTNEYRMYEMCSGADGNLYTAGTSSGKDWDLGSECRPSVFKNKDLIWTDYDHPGCGFWGIKEAFNDVFLGRTGRAAVVRLSDHKIVLDMPKFETVFSLVFDEVTATLIAFFGMSGESSGAISRAMATKDGNTWYQIDGDFLCPGLFFSFQDPATKKIYLSAGKWSQSVKDGYGRIYVSKRRSEL